MRKTGKTKRLNYIIYIGKDLPLEENDMKGGRRSKEKTDGILKEEEEGLGQQ